MNTSTLENFTPGQLESRSWGSADRRSERAERGLTMIHEQRLIGRALREGWINDERP